MTMTIIARGAYVAKHLYLIGDDCHLIMLTDLKKAEVQMLWWMLSL
jgi:hypothetical protein